MAVDAESLAELVADYETPGERRRQPLLNMLEARGAREAVPVLAHSTDPSWRRLAARLADLLPDREHVRALEPLALDPEQTVRVAAMSALAHQVRDSAWTAAMFRLSEAPDAVIQARASEILDGAAK